MEFMGSVFFFPFICIALGMDMGMDNRGKACHSRCIFNRKRITYSYELILPETCILRFLYGVYIFARNNLDNFHAGSCHALASRQNKILE